jgi:prepilin-type N-terminal cleavage/methylation domain-containing protein
MQTCVIRMPTKTQTATASQKGFVLAEMVVVIFIIGLFASLAMVNVMSILGRNTFKSRANDLVAVLRMAAAKAAESSRRYEIIIDFTTQSYTFREITSADLGADVLQEEILLQRTFGNDVHIKYVQFDDGTNTAQNQAKFRAGRAGWQFGGKIVLVDNDGMEYTIMINRINKSVELLDGDAEILAPREDLIF